MTTQIKQKVNSFDTIHLSIPEDIINRHKSNFSVEYKVNEETMELLEKDYSGLTQIHFIKNKNHLGLGHCTYVPHRNIYDVKISAKILREKYPTGITKNTIYDVINALEKYGIGDIEPEAFIERAEIRTCDNTFNIPVDNFTGEESIYECFSALSAFAVRGRKQKMNTFEADGVKNKEINGVVFGKNTRQNQSLTFYYKVDEAFANPEDNRNKPESVIMRKYGMDYKEFFAYFENKIRAELRLTSQVLMKNSFNLPKKTRNNVVLKDILYSKSNAMLKKFNEYVSERQTEIQMKKREKEEIILNTYCPEKDIFDENERLLYMWGVMLHDVIKASDGDVNYVLNYVRKKMKYKDGRISDTHLEKIQTLLNLYRIKKNKIYEVGVYINRYREINKKIKELV